MQILSYRGPRPAGGVSSGLSDISKQFNANKWIFLEDNAVRSYTAGMKTSQEAALLGTMDSHQIDQHYKFCNEFLWPLMHDMPERVRYDVAQHRAYRAVNAALGQMVRSADDALFMQDYQLALVASWLPRKRTKMIFWHIPFPKYIPSRFENVTAEIVRGLLENDVVGFHTHEYATNFVRFVQRHLDGFFWNAHHSCLVNSDTGRSTSVLIHPLGIDATKWKQLAACAGESEFQQPYILSVDRADYTKAIVERCKTIDAFFTRRPDLLGQMHFVQVCQRSRVGINAFDTYWEKCRTAHEELLARWATPSWSPLIWLDEPMQAPALAALYRNASAMLVNPKRDGLNLTAKEFVACQSRTTPGVLLLSTQAGAWDEFSTGAIPVSASDPVGSARNIDFAMQLTIAERRARMIQLNQALEANPISRWYGAFAQHAAARREMAFA